MTNIEDTITLRDYIATHALTAMIGNPNKDTYKKEAVEKFPVYAYEYADQMIVQKKLQEEVSFKTRIFIPLLWVSAILIVLDFILRIVLFFLAI